MKNTVINKEELSDLIGKGYNSVQIGTYFNRHPTTVRYFIKKYSLKLNFTSLTPIAKEKLIMLIEKGYSAYDISEELKRSKTTVRWWLKKYGLKINCGAMCTIKTGICKFCSKLFNYRTKKMYCSVRCHSQMKVKLIKESIKIGTYPSVPTRRFIYSMLCEDFGNKCSLCGLSGNDWNSKPIRLWVDHIDGCAANNSYPNFRLICPNCDSQLDTCRAKNKGKGRKSLGLRW